MHVLFLAALPLLVAPGPAPAAQVGEIDALHDWRLRALRFEGNAHVSSSDLRAVMATRPRRWFAVWRAYPPFDPIAFETDLDRVRAVYRSRGWYEARVTHDLELPAEGDDLVAVVRVDEGPVVRVGSVDVTFTGEPLAEAERARLLERLPLRPDEPFTERDYERGRAYLRAAFRARGHALVSVDKRARVDLEQHSAAVDYMVESGPPCVLGEVRVTGADRVDPAVVRREVAFTPGMPFSETPLATTRSNLEKLSLFRTVRLEEEPREEAAGEPCTVDVRIRVSELPPRAVSLGGGYDTDEGPRGLASWRHYDFRGGARQLGFTARVSAIRRSITADFVQPRWPLHTSTVRLIAWQEQQDEDTYTLLQTRGMPRLEWNVTPRLATFVFYRADLDLLSNVPRAVRRVLPGSAPSTAVLSGLALGASWNGTDDLFDPTRGWIAALTVEPVGLGGDLSFVRAVGQLQRFQPLPLGLVGTTRVRLGVAEPHGSSREVPLYERLYAGGANSVRGYARREVGPLVNDDPIGGRSLIELSGELRRRITDTIGAAVFLDAGQVALPVFDFPVDDLLYGTGLGLSYRTPIGPIRLDLAFPINKRPSDSAWQVYLSVGQVF